MRYQQGALKNNLIAMLLVLGGLAVLVTTMLPPSYNDDLTLIGKGKPAIVIVFDSGSMSSVQLVENLNPLKEKFSDQLNFLIADINSPDGAAFQRNNNVHDGNALFYTSTGEKIFELNGPLETDVLESIIGKTFGLN